MVTSPITELQRVKTAHRQLPEELRVNSKYAGWRVLGLVADNSACGYYRIILPLHMLKMMGAEVSYTSFQDGNSFNQYDIILAPRQHNREVLEVLRHAAWEGKLVIYEIDDDLHHVQPSNPAFSVYHQGAEELRMISEFLKCTHGWTTTTPELARLYYKHNTNPVVIDNFIDYSFRDWGVDVEWTEEGEPVFRPRTLSRPPEWEGKIVLAWSGGTTHQEDLEQVGPAIKAILKQNPQVLFAFYGSSDMYEWIISKYDLPRDSTTYVPSRHFMDYPSGLHGFDISLAPIALNQFNLCKSYLRIEEMLAVGSACIASNVGPYARWEAKHPGSIILVGNGAGCKSSWTQAIQYLIDNPEARKEMQERGRQLIMDSYSLEQNIHRWPAAWAAIAQQRELGNLGADKEKRPDSWYVAYGQAGRNDPCPCGSSKKYKQCHVSAWG